MEDNNPGKTLIALGIAIVIMVVVVTFLMILPSILEWIWDVYDHSPVLTLLLLLAAGLLCIFAGLIMKDYYD
jgi:H+/Cl- antiporter ClcA